MSKVIESAILFQVENNTFLLDIPYSIALAQGETAPCKQSAPPTAESSSRTQTNKSQRKQLLSCPPAKEPFPSTEPKKPSARAKVLESSPISERRFHSELILPLVKDSLETIRAGVEHDRWCLTRAVPCEEVHEYRVPDHTPSRKRRKGNDSTSLQPGPDGHVITLDEPPMILSSAAPNIFESLSELKVAKNPSSEAAIIQIGTSHETMSEYLVPPGSSFILCELPIFNGPDYHAAHENPIPGLSQRFNLILMDPPWPNRSVRRSGHYTTNHYSEMNMLTAGMRKILQTHSYRREDITQELVESQSGAQIQSQQSIAAIWITNAEKSRKAAYHAMSSAGFDVCEEWVWVKTTLSGQPISALDGLWRKPYEILVIGKQRPDFGISASSSHQTDDLTVVSEAVATRRVIAAVPDLHSRKPNLKSIFERVFFSSESSRESYTALEVFARNLTAGWWACGNEALKFNARECWVNDTTGNWFPE
jgi:N6-adenosine-specific RNA methylase IME4